MIGVGPGAGRFARLQGMQLFTQPYLHSSIDAFKAFSVGLVVMETYAAAIGKFNFHECARAAGVFGGFKEDDGIFLNRIVDFSFHVRGIIALKIKYPGIYSIYLI